MTVTEIGYERGKFAPLFGVHCSIRASNIFGRPFAGSLSYFRPRANIEEVARTPVQTKTTKKGGDVPLGKSGGVEVAVGAVAAPVLLRYDNVDDIVRVEGGLIYSGNVTSSIRGHEKKPVWGKNVLSDSSSVIMNETYPQNSPAAILVIQKADTCDHASSYTYTMRARAIDKAMQLALPPALNLWPASLSRRLDLRSPFENYTPTGRPSRCEPEGGERLLASVLGYGIMCHRVLGSEEIARRQYHGMHVHMHEYFFETSVEGRDEEIRRP
ncbi:hypothetical protein EDB92DRAFT_1820565 [Lactarius akahatsu]|uniref:Uncharacterized protein n=1 Tax=Lactarius akahatsu TaxID=416441 RepID=A0AAD4L4X0_9AGAM|nr:hypothetical protein EDB92DRAFT_1820565 [Lactarius akahatsu]